MRKLIFGCGYLGLRIARQWRAAGAEVLAVTRSTERAGQLRAEGLLPLVDDVVCPRQLPALDEFETVLFAIGYDRRGSSSMRDVYVQGLKNVLATAKQGPRRFLYISSTGVYGDDSEAWIDETSPCRPQREGGQICYDAERLLSGHFVGQRSIILRLSGLYGPGRVPRAADLMAGRPIAAPDRGTLNLIHVDDAVEVVLAAERAAPLPSLYLVSDGQPVQRADYFRMLAELLGAPPPTFVPPAGESPAAERARSSKRISNSKLLRELKVTLRYPSYRQGLAAIIEGQRSGSSSQPQN